MALPTVTMLAPPTFGGVVTGCPSGTVYQPGTSGEVQAYYADIGTLENLGFTVVAGAYPSSGMVAWLLGANFNTTSDQALVMMVPANKYFIPSKIFVTNASVSLTTAVGGIYDAAAKGGNAIVANSQVYSTLTGPTLALNLTLTTSRREPSTTQLYLSLSTAQGAAATADVYVTGDLLQQ